MRSKGHIYYSTDFYSISFTKSSEYLFVDWFGFQPKYSVKEGCDKALEVLTNLKLKKVLNNNTEVKGLWDAHWVACDWLPRMKDAGLKHFAWVLSHEALCEQVAKSVIQSTPVTDLIKTFETVQEAEKWLRCV